MRFLHTVFFLLLCSASLTAQITLTNSYFPNAGDSLVVSNVAPQFLTTARVTAGGANQTWDYTALRYLNTPTVRQVSKFLDAATDTAAIRLFPGVDLVVKANATQTACYNKTTTRFELMGFNGAATAGLGLPLVAAYTPTVLERRAPLVYNNIRTTTRSAFLIPFSSSIIPDSFLAIFPIRPDSLRIDFATTRTDQTDAWGTLRIANAPNAFDVLRDKRVEITETKIDAKFGRLWIDVTSIIFVGTANGNPSRDTTTSYYFWSNTAKEPILVLTANARDSITNGQIKYFPIRTDVGDLAATPSVALQLYPNPANDVLQLHFEQATSAPYHAQIVDISGKVHAQQTLDNHLTDASLPITQLPKGVYFLVLRNPIDGQVAVSRKFVR